MPGLVGSATVAADVTPESAGATSFARPKSRILTGVGDLRREREQLFGRDRAGRDQVAYRGSAHQLHRNPWNRLRRPDLVDGDDAGMIQGRGGPGFLLEPRKPLRVSGERLREHLDGHLPPETRITRAPDFAHPARTHGSEDLVRPELRTGLDGQGRPPKSGDCSERWRHIGGGISGLSAAYYLYRSGIRATVLEKARKASDVSSGLTCPARVTT